MKKALTLLIIILFSLAVAGNVFCEEMAKEGTASGITYYTSTSQMLAQDVGYVQVNYDARGVYSTDDNTNPFYGASCQCVGALKIVKGEYKESGLCTYTRPDKDKIFMSYEGTGKGGQAKGDWIIVGGTGKCNGMNGDGQWTRTSLQGPVEGSSGASFSKSTGSWKLP